MDSHQFRSILLKLQDRLSDNDRQRLHFFLGDDIPRRIRDNPTLPGTLNLLECLFDQDKINEQDFTFLINAFKEIQCIDAVKLLKGYKERMQTSRCNQPSLTSIMPPLNEEIIQDQEDNSPSYNLLQQINNFGNYNNIINKNNTNINPVTIKVENEKLKENNSVDFSLKFNRYFFSICLLLMIIFGLLIFNIFILKNKQINSNDIQKAYEKLSEEQKSKDNTILTMKKQMNDSLFQQNNKKPDSLVFSGQIFGNSNEPYFDDSLKFDFTCSFYLNGLYVRDNNHDGLESYQFFYLSSHNHEKLIESEFHGKQTNDFKKKFYFPSNEKISKVKGRLIKKDIISSNGMNVSITIITGLEFFSNKGRMSPSYSSRLGEEFREEYEGYSLGYVTGRSGQYIEQVQFVWYRTEDANSNED